MTGVVDIEKGDSDGDRGSPPVDGLKPKAKGGTFCKDRPIMAVLKVACCSDTPGAMNGFGLNDPLPNDVGKGVTIPVLDDRMGNRWPNAGAPSATTPSAANHRIDPDMVKHLFLGVILLTPSGEGQVHGEQASSEKRFVPPILPPRRLNK